MFGSSDSNPSDSPSYRLAIDDPDFLRRDEIRSLRFALEFAKIDHSLRDWGIMSMVAMFGSARSASPETVADLERRGLNRAGQGTVALSRELDQARRSTVWYEGARETARLISERGGARRPYGRDRHNVVCTGGGPGVMEAANRGAREAGAPTVGLAITLPNEQGCNAWITPELSFRCHYFAMRKMHLVMRASAAVVFPGGYGTFDELFEVLCLRQTGKGHAFPIVLYGSDFWKKAFDIRHLLDHGMISPGDELLIRYVDTPEECWENLIEGGLKIPAY
jgi:uncharacterized protein (TIGR00730 family)